MIDGREVRTECKIIEIRVALWRAEWRINQFPICAQQRYAPSGELLLQRAKLSAGQCVSESARAAMRQEADTAIAQTKRVRRLARAIAVVQANDFALTEMIAAAV